MTTTRHRRRSHSSIAGLPQEAQEKVNEMLVTSGRTYQDVVDLLEVEGFRVSHSAVGRYGKDFLTRLEKIEVIQRQAKAIVTESGDGPATQMHEAANKLAMSLIMERLMAVDDLEGEKISDLLMSLARLERSATSRENLKLKFESRVKATAGEVAKKLKSKGLSAETVEFIEKEILGLVRN